MCMILEKRHVFLCLKCINMKILFCVNIFTHELGKLKKVTVLLIFHSDSIYSPI